MEAEKYLQTAKEVMNFINTRKKQGKKAYTGLWKMRLLEGRYIMMRFVCMQVHQE